MRTKQPGERIAPQRGCRVFGARERVRRDNAEGRYDRDVSRRQHRPPRPASYLYDTKASRLPPGVIYSLGEKRTANSGLAYCVVARQRVRMGGGGVGRHEKWHLTTLPKKGDRLFLAPGCGSAWRLALAYHRAGNVAPSRLCAPHPPPPRPTCPPPHLQATSSQQPATRGKAPLHPAPSSHAKAMMPADARPAVAAVNNPP